MGCDCVVDTAVCFTGYEIICRSETTSKRNAITRKQKTETSVFSAGKMLKLVDVKLIMFFIQVAFKTN